MKGFSLLEMMFSLVIVGILLLVGTGYSSYLYRVNEQKLFIDEIRTAIQYARIQATLLHSETRLGPVNGNWSEGMELMRYDARERRFQMLHQWVWNYPQWVLDWKGARGGKALVFSDSPLNAMSNGRFDLYHLGSKKHFSLVVNRLGRVKE